jgi:uncharacterized protein (TIGR03437 family)
VIARIVTVGLGRLLIWLAVPAAAQPVISDVRNAASRAPSGLPHAAIARGSVFAVFGKEIGPSDPVVNPGFPLTDELGGCSVKVNTAAGSLRALLLYAGSTQLEALLTSAASTGTATLEVSCSGRTSEPFPFAIADSSPGLFSKDHLGSGPAMAQSRNDDGLVMNSFATPVVPGATLILSATGLGPVSGDEAAVPTVEPIDVGDFSVVIGSRDGRVLYKGRSDCCAGIDSIVVEVPSSVELGCYVPTYARANGVVSNVVTVAITADGSPCTDRGGLTDEELRAAQERGSRDSGIMVVSRTTARIGDPAEPNHSHTGALSGTFFRVHSSFADAGGQLIPPLGTCYAASYRSVGAVAPPASRPEPLDAGSRLRIIGERGAIEAAPTVTGLYIASLGDIVVDVHDPRLDQFEYLVPGVYQIDNGAGSADVQPFAFTLPVPSFIKWRNEGDLDEIDRGADLILTWDAADGSGLFTIQGISFTDDLRTQGTFQCVAEIGAGQFTVPRAFLANLPRTGVQPSGLINGLLILERTITKPQRTTADGGIEIPLAQYKEHLERRVFYR